MERNSRIANNYRSARELASLSAAIQSCISLFSKIRFAVGVFGPTSDKQMSPVQKLAELAKTIRSKSVGVGMITLAIALAYRRDYERIRRSSGLTRACIAALCSTGRSQNFGLSSSTLLQGSNSRSTASPPMAALAIRTSSARGLCAATLHEIAGNDGVEIR